MGGKTDVFDLGRLNLHSGEGRRLQLDVGFDALELGGQRYEVDGRCAPVILDVSHTTTGWSLRLRFDVRLQGACMRCLEPAHRVVSIDAREVDQPGGGEELDSPYLDDAEELDLQQWANDAFVLALPAQVVCRPDCAGLCPECGVDLNEAGPEHAHESAPDPRWAALDRLKFD
jgi:uncharacterized protein